MNYSIYIKQAQTAASKASVSLLKYFVKVDKLAKHKKSAHEIVTPADLAANKIIIGHLAKQFPSHAFLSEETGQDRVNSEFLWVIDPLDGTSNFALGNHFFNISIALVHQNRIVAGIIYAPFFKQMFTAEINRGAYLNRHKIKVSSVAKPIDAKINFGYATVNQKNQQITHIHGQLINHFQNIHNLGAAALELAWVAMGRLEAYLLPHTKPWDIAAGTLLVKEAGGQVTDWHNKTYEFSTKQTGSLIASNHLIHPALVRHIKV